MRNKDEKPTPCVVAFANFFSDKLNFRKERITPKEGMLRRCPSWASSSSKLSPAKEESLTPKKEKATLLTFTGVFSNLIAPTKEKMVTPWEGEAATLR